MNTFEKTMKTALHGCSKVEEPLLSNKGRFRAIATMLEIALDDIDRLDPVIMNKFKNRVAEIYASVSLARANLMDMGDVMEVSEENPRKDAE